ncbi:TPA: phage holin family protein [Photobacterium damselae]|uniref:phage holin family protein n=1 Tax=Photobacterium damselae TaxID=38293 RepID=UPI001EFEE311|nr:phage holin family protein [Photobacterium damselae]MCG9778729.1 phage holin family protein [Photobacterium damselae]
MNDLFDRVTSYLAYLMSAIGIFVSSMSLEDWYFFSSICIGIFMLGINIWHKRVMQRIAREKGIFLNEQN